MTTRYEHQGDCCGPECGVVESPEGEFVRYSDYNRLVQAARDAVIDLDLDRPVSAKRDLEKALINNGEDI